MELAVAKIIETSIISGCLVYLLYNVVRNMQTITSSMSGFGETLVEVSNTLLKIDMRIEILEKRVASLEDRRGGKDYEKVG